MTRSRLAALVLSLALATVAGVPVASLAADVAQLSPAQEPPLFCMQPSLSPELEALCMTYAPFPSEELPLGLPAFCMDPSALPPELQQVCTDFAPPPPGGLAPEVIEELVRQNAEERARAGGGRGFVFWLTIAGLVIGVAASLGPLAGFLLRAHPPRLRGMRLGADALVARRGDEVVVSLEVDRRGPVRGHLEVGLVCIERYTVEMRTRRGVVPTPKEEAAHEEWRSIEGANDIERATFTIPPDTPFSHDGRFLSFRWSLVAREVRPRGRDPRQELALRVLP